MRKNRRSREDTNSASRRRTRTKKHGAEEAGAEGVEESTPQRKGNMSLRYHPQGYRYRSATKITEGATVCGEQGSDSDVAELSDLEDDDDDDDRGGKVTTGDYAPSLSTIPIHFSQIRRDRSKSMPRSSDSGRRTRNFQIVSLAAPFLIFTPDVESRGLKIQLT